MNVKPLRLAASASILFATSIALGGWIRADESHSSQQHPTLEQIVGLVRSGADDEQATALLDGVLTREEYELARDRVVACLESHGFTVHRDAGAGVGGVDEIWTESPASLGAMREEFLACYERHQGKLSMVWAEQNRPTPDHVAARERAIRSCMTQQGFQSRPLEDFWGKDEAQTRAYGTCLAEVGRPGE